MKNMAYLPEISESIIVPLSDSLIPSAEKTHRETSELSRTNAFSPGAVQDGNFYKKLPDALEMTR